MTGVFSVLVVLPAVDEDAGSLVSEGTNVDGAVVSEGTDVDEVVVSRSVLPFEQETNVRRIAPHSATESAPVHAEAFFRPFGSFRSANAIPAAAAIRRADEATILAVWKNETECELVPFVPPIDPAAIADKSAPLLCAADESEFRRLR